MKKYLIFTLFSIFFIFFTLKIQKSSADDNATLLTDLNSHQTFQNVTVERVLSADTLILEGGEKIQLIGLKAPDAPRRPKIEYDKNGFPIEPAVLPENTLEEKAFAFAYHMMIGKKVRLEFDEDRTSADFATLAYVFLTENGVMVNTEILRYGYADLQIQPPNFKYEEELRTAYQEARKEKRGIQSN